jgi:protein-disulfide isomerase
MVAVIFRHFPLQKIHNRAIPAAVAASCAGRQGRFWEMHDALFSTELVNQKSDYVELADLIGLDRVRLASCLSDDSLAAEVTASATEALSLDVTVTPTLFLAKRLADGTAQVTHHLRGAASFDKLQPLIEQLLAESR